MIRWHILTTWAWPLLPLYPEATRPASSIFRVCISALQHTGLHSTHAGHTCSAAFQLMDIRLCSTGKQFQVLGMHGWTRSEIGSKGHRDLITERAWDQVFIMAPVTERLRTPCDHLVMKKGLSPSTAAVWGHWWQADGFQKSTPSPGPCDSVTTWCCNTRASSISPRGMSPPCQQCVPVCPEIPAEHHQHQQNHVTSHTGLHQQHKLRLWAQSWGILEPCQEQCLKLPHPLILPKFKREITAHHHPALY